jgi:molecular chaperone DnaK
LTTSTEGNPDDASAPPSDNRRRQDRFSVELDISLETEHNFYAGFVENLSNSGLFIATHSIRPIGALVEFSISIGESPEPVKGVGEVRWVRQYSETSDSHPGMGLRFIELSPDSRRRIEAFLVGREPIFYDDEL